MRGRRLPANEGGTCCRAFFMTLRRWRMPRRKRRGFAECYYRQVLRRWVICAQTKQEFLKRSQVFAGGMDIFDVQTRSVTIFFLRLQRGFGTLGVSKGCFVRHAVIRLRLSRASSQKMMPGRLSFDTGVANANSVLKERWSGSGNTARAAILTKTSISRSPCPSQAAYQAFRKPWQKPDVLLNTPAFDPAPGHASLTTLYTFFRVYLPLDHALSS